MPIEEDRVFRIIGPRISHSYWVRNLGGGHDHFITLNFGLRPVKRFVVTRNRKSVNGTGLSGGEALCMIKGNTDLVSLNLQGSKFGSLVGNILPIGDTQRVQSQTN